MKKIRIRVDIDDVNDFDIEASITDISIAHSIINAIIGIFSDFYGYRSNRGYYKDDKDIFEKLGINNREEEK